MTPLSPVSDADPDIQTLLEQVQELMGIEGPATASSLVPAHQYLQGSQEKGVKVPLKSSIQKVHKFQKFQDRFKQLLTKFSRTDQGPITLSSGLVPERDESTEAMEKHYAALFG